MAVHPKITALGLATGMVVGSGLVLFLLGRLTVGSDLTAMLAGVGLGLGLLSLAGLAIIRSLPTSRIMEGLLHKDSQPSWDGYVSAEPRVELIGLTGVAVTELRPSGVAEINGERVDVTTDADWLPTGTPLTVVKAEAMRVVVRRAPQLSA